MTEQFAFQQILRNGRAVYGQKSQFAPLAVMVNGARHQFLARATLAGDQSSGVAGRQLPDHFENFLHDLASPDDSLIVVLRFQQRLI